MYEFRCRLTEKPINQTWELLPNYYKLCSKEFDNCPKQPVMSYCGAPYEHNIPWNDKEINNYHFNYGITGFDNIF